MDKTDIALEKRARIRLSKSVYTKKSPGKEKRLKAAKTIIPPPDLQYSVTLVVWHKVFLT